jgi:hypothetical protein
MGNSKGEIMSETPKQTKNWKQVGIFNSFEDADSLRKELLNEDESGKLEVRVKRYGRRDCNVGAKFKVKVVYPIVPKATKKEKKRGK